MDYIVAYTIRMSLVFFVRPYLILQRNFFRNGFAHKVGQLSSTSIFVAISFVFG